jgi:hypothetical protein
MRNAEGVPFDETILESILHGLVTWGPLKHPIENSLDGFASLAYHHLVFLDLGLVGFYSGLGPYEALLIAGPIISSCALVSALLLVTNNWLRHYGLHNQMPRLVALSLVAFLLALRVTGINSPSTFFGIAAVLSALAVGVRPNKQISEVRNLTVFAVSLIVVAFAKGPFLYMPLVVFVVFAVGNSRGKKTTVFLMVLFVALVQSLFSWASPVAGSFSLVMWHRELLGPFAFSLSTLTSLHAVLVVPVVIGIASSAVLLLVDWAEAQRWLISFLSTVALAIGSQVFTTVPTGGFEYLYVPGVVAAHLTLILLSVSAVSRSLLSPRMFAPFAFIVLAIALLVRELQSRTFNPLSAGALLVLVICLGFVTFLKFDARGEVARRYVHKLSVWTAAGLLIISISTHIIEDAPKYSQQPTETVVADWLGTPSFIEVADFIKRNTDRNSLFAYSLCGLQPKGSCALDLRPSALTNRRFLTLNMYGFLASGSPLSNAEFRNDLRWSQQIGQSAAVSVINYLKGRGVHYILASTERVPDVWITAAVREGGKEVFRNPEFVLLEVPN